MQSEGKRAEVAFIFSWPRPLVAWAFSPIFYPTFAPEFKSFVFGHSCSILIMLSVFLFTPVRFSQAKYKKMVVKEFFSLEI